MEGEAAVGGLGGDRSIDIGDVDAAVFGMEFRGEVAWDVQAEVDIPTAAEEAEEGAGGRGALGADGAVGEDFDFLEQGFGLLGAGLLDDNAGLESNVLSIFADDLNAAVFGGNGDLAIDEWQGGAAKFADLFFAAEEVAGVGVALVSAAVRGGDGLGVERDGGQECQGQGKG